VYGLFHRGIADGTLRSDLSPEVLMLVFTGLLETAIRMSGPNGIGAEQTSAAIVSVFLDGARQQNPHPQQT